MSLATATNVCYYARHLQEGKKWKRKTIRATKKTMQKKEDNTRMYQSAEYPIPKCLQSVVDLDSDYLWTLYQICSNVLKYLADKDCISSENQTTTLRLPKKLKKALMCHDDEISLSEIQQKITNVLVNQ